MAAFLLARFECFPCTNSYTFLLLLVGKSNTVSLVHVVQRRSSNCEQFVNFLSCYINYHPTIYIYVSHVSIFGAQCLRDRGCWPGSLQPLSGFCYDLRGGGERETRGAEGEHGTAWGRNGESQGLSLSLRPRGTGVWGWKKPRWGEASKGQRSWGGNQMKKVPQIMSQNGERDQRKTEKRTVWA